MAAHRRECCDRIPDNDSIVAQLNGWPKSRPERYERQGPDNQSGDCAILQTLISIAKCRGKQECAEQHDEESADSGAAPPEQAGALAHRRNVPKPLEAVKIAAAGEWVPIDPTLVRDAGWRNAAGRVTARFAASAGVGATATLEAGGRVIQGTAWVDPNHDGSIIPAPLAI